MNYEKELKKKFPMATLEPYKSGKLSFVNLNDEVVKEDLPLSETKLFAWRAAYYKLKHLKLL